MMTMKLNIRISIRRRYSTTAQRDECQTSNVCSPALGGSRAEWLARTSHQFSRLRWGTSGTGGPWTKWRSPRCWWTVDTSRRMLQPRLLWDNERVNDVTGRSAHVEVELPKTVNEDRMSTRCVTSKNTSIWLTVGSTRMSSTPAWKMFSQFAQSFCRRWYSKKFPSDNSSTLCALAQYGRRNQDTD